MLKKICDPKKKIDEFKMPNSWINGNFIIIIQIKWDTTKLNYKQSLVKSSGTVIVNGRNAWVSVITLMISWIQSYQQWNVENRLFSSFQFITVNRMPFFFLSPYKRIDSIDYNRLRITIFSKIELQFKKKMKLKFGWWADWMTNPRNYRLLGQIYFGLFFVKQNK